MKNKRLLGEASNRGGEAIAAGGKLEDQNKAVARAAFFDYLNHRDIERFEETQTRDFVKHCNNSPAENLSEAMRDAKGQFDSSSGHDGGALR